MNPPKATPMPKKLDQKDFRAGRWVLLPYAIESTRPTMPIRDLIDQGTWETIIQLPFDPAERLGASYYRAGLRTEAQQDAIRRLDERERKQEYKIRYLG